MLWVTKSVTDDEPVTARDCSLRFVVETEPWLRVFLRNFADLFRPAPPQVWLTATPGEYWPDATVDRPVAWNRLRQSFLGHVLFALAVYWITLLWLNRPQIVVEEVPRTSITHYQLSEYLPPMAPREKAAPPSRARPQKADPELAKQEIVSVHAGHNSLKQTIVHPNPRLLTQDTALPNLVALTPIPSAAPVAANRPLQNLPLENTQVVPPTQQTAPRSRLIFPLSAPPQTVPPAQTMAANRSVAAIPSAAPDVIPPAAPIARAHKDTVVPLNGPVIVPPMEQPIAHNTLSLPTQAPEVTAPPSSIARRTHESLPIAAPTVVPPSQSLITRNLTALATAAPPQAVVPPPEPIASGGDTRSPAVGQLLALNLRPQPPAGPVNVPEGNRPGEFAAGPTGHPGATARPEIVVGNSNGGNRNSNNSIPANTYVAAPVAKPTAEAVVASPASIPAIKPISPDRVDTSTDRLEREIFGDRRRYAVRLSMPNLNSSIGSWIMRFARLNSQPGTEEEIGAPEPLHKVDPAYPASYVHDRIEGTVVLYGVIHSDGSVGDVRILEGFDSVLDENARAALEKWRFRPGTRNGNPVDVEVVVRVPFRVPRAPF
jgi:TonB family protein